MTTTKIIINSPVGHLKLIEENNHITTCIWTEEPVSTHKPTGLLARACKQLQEYFAGEREKFDLPLKTTGTAFQQQVWAALQDIPYGKTKSYQGLATAINNPKACRAVGSANGKNPICIIIPCHRVINASGALGGFGGGINNKQILLNLESEYAQTAQLPEGFEFPTNKATPRKNPNDLSDSLKALSSFPDDFTIKD